MPVFSLPSAGQSRPLHRLHNGSAMPPSSAPSWPGDSRKRSFADLTTTDMQPSLPPGKFNLPISPMAPMQHLTRCYYLLFHCSSLSLIARDMAQRVYESFVDMQALAGPRQAPTARRLRWPARRSRRRCWRVSRWRSRRQSCRARFQRRWRSRARPTRRRASRGGTRKRRSRRRRPASRCRRRRRCCRTSGAPRCSSRQRPCGLLRGAQAQRC